MNIETILNAVKIDLGITTDKYDERLRQIIQYSISEIERQGATLANNLDDAQIVTMYAVWTWRKREHGEGMPRMLRYALNNRIFQEKIKAKG